MRRTRITLGVIAAIAMSGLVASPALATNGQDNPNKPNNPNKPTKLAGGSTTLTVPDATLAALTGAGFAVAPVAPATASGATFTFPIAKGHYKPRKQGARANWRAWFRGNWGYRGRQRAFIKHDGGLTFTKDATSVKLSQFRIWARGKRGILEGKVNDRGRVKIANLSDVTIADGKGTAQATLSAAAANGLNRAFGVTLFTKGLALGTVTVTPPAS